MKKLLVRLGFKHMGNHSGYDNVFQYLQNANEDFISVFKKESTINNIKSLFLYLKNKEIPRTSFYLKRAFELERRAINILAKNDSKIIHYTYVENNFALLKKCHCLKIICPLLW